MAFPAVRLRRAAGFLVAVVRIMNSRSPWDGVLRFSILYSRVLVRLALMPCERRRIYLYYIDLYNNLDNLFKQERP